MASGFLVPDRDQSFLEAVSYWEVLGDDHPVWTVISVVEGMDLSGLYARYGVDQGRGGRPAFDPAMLLSLLLFGYCEGKLSSRGLEEACRRDWAYRAICGDVPPDHSTIARFREGLDDVIESLFAQVLAVCSEAGMGEVGMVALDGTRMGAAASKESNRTAETLERMEVEARRMLDEAAAADRADRDDSDGGGSGSGAVRRETERQRRLERIRRAQEVVAEAEARRVAEEKKRGRPKRPVANVTDPDSRLQSTRQGFIQGYNSQAVVTADQIVVAAEVISDPTDVACFGPMVTATGTNLTEAGIPTPVGGVWLADAGYWSEANAALGAMLNIDPLIATTRTHRVGTVSPSEDVSERDRTRIGMIRRIEADEVTVAAAAAELDLSSSYVSKLVSRYRRYGDLASAATHARREMEAKLSKPANKERYRQRGWLIEGSFAHTKVHRKSGRFLRRGLTAVDAEWKLINMAGNLAKLHRRRWELSPTPRCFHYRLHRRRYRPHRDHTPQHPRPQPLNHPHRWPNTETR